MEHTKIPLKPCLGAEAGHEQGQEQGWGHGQGGGHGWGRGQGHGQRHGQGHLSKLKRFLRCAVCGVRPLVKVLYRSERFQNILNFQILPIAWLRC